MMRYTKIFIYFLVILSKPNNLHSQDNPILDLLNEEISEFTTLIDDSISSKKTDNSPIWVVIYLDAKVEKNQCINNSNLHHVLQDLKISIEDFNRRNEIKFKHRYEYYSIGQFAHKAIANILTAYGPGILSGTNVRVLEVLLKELSDNSIDKFKVDKSDITDKLNPFYFATITINFNCENQNIELKKNLFFRDIRNDRTGFAGFAQTIISKKTSHEYGSKTIYKTSNNDLTDDHKIITQLDPTSPDYDRSLIDLVESRSLLNNHYFTEKTRHRIFMFMKNVLSQDAITNWSKPYGESKDRYTQGLTNGYGTDWKYRYNEKNEGFIKFSNDNLRIGNEAFPIKKLYGINSSNIDAATLFSKLGIDRFNVLSHFVDSTSADYPFGYNNLLLDQAEGENATLATKFNDRLWGQMNDDNYETLVKSDLFTFVTDYSTSLITSDVSGINRAWMDVSFRQFNSVSGNEKVSKGEEIAEALIGLRNRRDLWVVYDLEKGNHISFFHEELFDKSVNTYEFTPNDLRRLPNEINYFYKTRINQSWLNLLGNKITYFREDTVSFILNLFNVQLFKDSLEAKINDKNYTLDLKTYIGLRSYLLSLFINDTYATDIKIKYRSKKVFRELLSSKIPTYSYRNDFYQALEQLKKQIEHENNAAENFKSLYDFFNSKDYEQLHLAYNPFHLVYIQILASITDPESIQLSKPIFN